MWMANGSYWPSFSIIHYQRCRYFLCLNFSITLVTRAYTNSLPVAYAVRQMNFFLSNEKDIPNQHILPEGQVISQNETLKLLNLHLLSKLKWYVNF